MRRRATFTIHRSFDRPRDWFRQHCDADSACICCQSTCGETCYDVWLCPDQIGGASDDKCELTIS
eukprot:6202617-Pyramimonas_sp.AAC.1